MSTRFRRGFQLERLQEITAAHQDHWFNDLLRCWKPGGVPSGTDGLRLAIRNGYLNFYRFGQSVARVGPGSHGVPWLQVHWKYATSRAPAGTPYVRLVDRQLLKSGRPVGTAYSGGATLGRWTQLAGKKAGAEKTAVDGIVAANGAIIDLEVSAPAEKPPFRIDLVALEKEHGGLQVVFWEAKLWRDARLVSRGVPKVIEQMRTYAKFLEAKGNAACVLSAYVNDCRLLRAFHGMASQVERGIPPLDATVVAVAEGASVTLDTRPRLVIVTEPSQQPTASWEGHLEKLRKQLSVVVLPKGGEFRLPSGGSV